MQRAKGGEVISRGRKFQEVSPPASRKSANHWSGAAREERGKNPEEKGVFILRE